LKHIELLEYNDKFLYFKQLLPDFTSTEMASRDDCRLHRPSSLYTRNSEGMYSTYAPICNGCEYGTRDMLDNAAAERVRELSGDLARVMDAGAPWNGDAVKENLHTAINVLESRCSDIMTPVSIAKDILVKYTAFRTCAIAYELTRAALAASMGLLTDEVRMSIDALERGLEPRELLESTSIYAPALALYQDLNSTMSTGSAPPSESAPIEKTDDELLAETL
jgi:hypothetical protein